jgi:hypothetical protein
LFISTRRPLHLCFTCRPRALAVPGNTSRRPLALSAVLRYWRVHLHPQPPEQQQQHDPSQQQYQASPFASSPPLHPRTSVASISALSFSQAPLPAAADLASRNLPFGHPTTQPYAHSATLHSTHQQSSHCNYCSFDCAVTRTLVLRHRHPPKTKGALDTLTDRHSALQKSRHGTW